MTRSESGKIGALISAMVRRKKSIDSYLANPVICRACGNILPVKNNESVKQVREKSFCNHSCSASYSNAIRTRKRIKINNCLCCGKHIDSVKRRNKYCSLKCFNSMPWKILKSKILKHKKIVGKCDESNQKHARRFLLEEVEYKCSVCGGKTWNGKKIPLVVDHKNGKSSDWGLNNLRLICCNCDAQSSTYCGRNLGNGRKYRRDRYLTVKMRNKFGIKN